MPGRPLVLDASTAILLAKIDLLRVVALAGEVWMAESAFREATVKEAAADAQLIRRLAEEGLLKRAASGRADLAAFRKDFRLDEGETETIALAKEKGAIAGTDDGPAIRCLKVMGLPFTSAIAILIAMAEAGSLAQELALELLTKLERFGRYDPRILEDAAHRIRSVGGKKSGGS